MARPSAAADIWQARTLFAIAAKKVAMAQLICVSARHIYKTMPDQVELNKVALYLFRSRCGPIAAAEPGSEAGRPSPWQPVTSQQP